MPMSRVTLTLKSIGVLHFPGRTKCIVITDWNVCSRFHQLITLCTNLLHCTKKEFSIKDIFSKVTFTEEILNGKLHFWCCVTNRDRTYYKKWQLFCCKMWRKFVTKELRIFLQIETVLLQMQRLLQNATFILKCVSKNLNPSSFKSLHQITLVQQNINEFSPSTDQQIMNYK